MIYKNSSKYMLVLFLISGSASVYADFLRDVGHAVAAPIKGAAHIAEDAVVVTADTAETAVVGAEKIVTAPLRNHVDHADYIDYADYETVSEDIE